MGEPAASSALPILSAARRRYHERMRRLFRPLIRLIVRVIAEVRVEGVDRVPARGPAVLAFNHIGHLDAFLIYLTLATPPEFIGLADLLKVPVVGWAFRQYGAVPVHRDEFDRAVLETALGMLDCGLQIALAPEARQSRTGQLERARTGVAYLAMKARAPVVPVAVTGTRFVGKGLAKFRRAHLSITYGHPIHLPALPRNGAERKLLLREQADRIMLELAALLPEGYRGVYGQASPRAPSTTFAGPGKLL